MTICCLGGLAFLGQNDICSSWLYEKCQEVASEFILTHRVRIFYAGFGCATLAVLAALIAKTCLAVFYLFAAALLLGAAAWAFRVREEVVSRDLGNRNDELFRSVNKANVQLNEEKRVHIELLETNEMLAKTLESKRSAILLLQEYNQSFFEENEKLRLDNEAFQQANSELEQILESIEKSNEKIANFTGRRIGY